VNAVSEQLRRMDYAPPFQMGHPLAFELAQELARMLPKGIDHVFFGNSGSEAVDTALKIALAYWQSKGQPERVRFIGRARGYHGVGFGGTSVGGIEANRKQFAAQLLPAVDHMPHTHDLSRNAYSRGQPTHGADFADSLDVLIEKHGAHTIAAVIVEPVAANMGVVPPAPGFLDGLREACTAAGALLIFDEVITGCRIARGGATEHFGVTPDLWCFGKVIGGGLPVGAFGGSRELMGHLAPIGDVYQAGTLSGNPLATAAGLTVLGLLDDTAYTMLSARAGELQLALQRAIGNAGLPVRVPRVGTLVGLHFSDSDVHDYDQAKAAVANGRYRRFFRAMLERGVALAPGPYEALFPSLAHTWDDIERTEVAATDAAREVAAHA